MERERERAREREREGGGENCEQQPSENPVDFKYGPLR